MKASEKMEKCTKLNFSVLYETIISRYVDGYSIPKELSQQLQEKRKYGLEKYKENSFQISFENSVLSPVGHHAQEEIVDLINYLLHEQYKCSVTGVRIRFKKEIKLLVKLYNKLDKLLCLDVEPMDQK
jgi:hypothetical protein